MNAEPRVRVGAGDGVVVRFGRVVAVVVGGTAAPLASLVPLLERLGGEADLDAQRFSRELLSWLSRPDDDGVPDIGVVALLGDDLVVVLHGGVECRVSGAGDDVTLRGRDAAVSLNVVVDGPFTRAALGPEGADATDGAPSSHLVAGVVPGATAVIVNEPADPARAAEPLPAEAVEHEPAVPLAPDDLEEPETTELAAPEPVDVPPSDPEEASSPARRAPLPTADEEAAPDRSDADLSVLQSAVPSGADGPVPLVEGIECDAGHFNHPYALQCSACGASLLDSVRRTVTGPRLTLGTITFDDGTSFVLQRDYVIGREPEQDPAVAADEAVPLRLDDPDHLISRVHAAVHLRGWDVQIIDRGSANGTYVLPPEGNEWQRLASDEPQTISPGTRVSIGRKVMTYEW